MHRSSRVDHKISLLALSTKVLALPKHRQEVKRICFEFLRKSFAKSHASLPLPCFVFRSFLQLLESTDFAQGSHFLNDSLRKTFLFPNFGVTHRGLRNPSQLSIVPQTFSEGCLGTHNPIEWFWATHQCHWVEIYTCHHTCIRIQSCGSNTRRSARSHTTVLAGKFSHGCLPFKHEGLFSRRSPDLQSHLSYQRS